MGLGDTRGYDINSPAIRQVLRFTSILENNMWSLLLTRLVAWWHLAITWTNVHLSSKVWCDIHQRAMLMNLICSEITLLTRATLNDKMPFAACISIRHQIVYKLEASAPTPSHPTQIEG